MTQPDPDRQLRGAGGGRALSRRAVLIGAAAAGVAVAGAVALPRVVSPDEPTVAPETTEEIDQFHPGDADFFSAFRLDGASELEHYSSLAEMTTAASATITGRVVDVVATRTIVGEGADRIGMVGLVVEPDVLNGDLPAKWEDRLVVEFLGGSEPVERTVARMRRTLPKGTAVWFLRSKAEEAEEYADSMRRLGRKIPKSVRRNLEVDKRYYRLVSSQGFYIQGEEQIDNPVADPAESASDPLRHEADKIERMSTLTEKVRRVR